MSTRLLRLSALSSFLVGFVACSSSSLTDGGQSRDAGHDTSAGACWTSSDCNGNATSNACVFPGQIVCPVGVVCAMTLSPCTSDSDCAGDAAVPEICEDVPCWCTGSKMGCFVGCAQDTDCGEGQMCRADHRCVALTCGAQGPTCPADFVCGSNGTCNRKGCTSDSECSKACLGGQCYSTPGRCGY